MHPFLSAGLKAEGIELESARLSVMAAGVQRSSSPAVFVKPGGSAGFQSCPGIFNKGPPISFTLGSRLEHMTLTPEGHLLVLQGMNTYSGKTIRFAAGTIQVDLDFGANLQMAGNNAKLTISGDAQNPGSAYISIERTEPIEAPAPKKKGNK